MDKAERTRLKTLANDAVIATFGMEVQRGAVGSGAGAVR